jgi:hypothetical protein
MASATLGGMPRNPAAPVPLSLGHARRLWLCAQRLDTRAPFGAGPAATRDAVAHLGYVQIDTINVIERCHHHILFTRIPEYRRSDLAHAQSVEKSVFEYWTHALSYVPTASFRFHMRSMRNDWRDHPWFTQVSAPEVRRMLARIEAGGPLSIRDIDDDALVEKDHAWASRKPSRRVMQLAFMQGQLAISRRDGMLKTYDLLQRHFGWTGLPQPARESEITAHLLDRAVTAQGVVSLDSICHLAAPRKPAIARLIEARVRAGQLRAVAVEGFERVPHWAPPALLEAPPPAPDATLVHILSPFDPVVIQRRRLAAFFGHEHRFEAYVPAAKRVFGYFALPVLLGDAIVAVLDLKAERATGRLRVQHWHWVGQGRPRPHKRLIEDELDRFARFQFGD